MLSTLGLRANLCVQMILEEFGKTNQNGTGVRDQFYSSMLGSVAQVLYLGSEFCNISAHVLQCNT